MDRREEESGRRRAGAAAESENDRFKRGYGRRVWIALIAAVLAHAAVFASGRGLTLEVPEAAPARDGFEGVLVEPEIDLPAPPPPIREPSVPEVETVGLDGADALPAEMVEFDDGARAVLPAPPPVASAAAEADEYRKWVPSIVRPRLENPEEVRRALQREYPRHLIRAGVTARVIMWFWIDETGAVEDYEIQESSGYDALDRAAREVVEVMRFRPAEERGEPVKVIVALPIRFEIE